MSVADTYVRARIDSHTKARASDALEAMGLSMSDAIRLLMSRIADERRLPFEVQSRQATMKTKPPLRERLTALAREVDALSPRVPVDTRSDDEVLGYNELGVW